MIAQIASLWVYPKFEQVVLHGDEADIGRYAFSSRVIAKTFCKHCGVVMTNAHNELPPDEVAALSERKRSYYFATNPAHPVNTRVLTGIEVGKLRYRDLDGWKDIPPPYVNP